MPRAAPAATALSSVTERQAPPASGEERRTRKTQPPTRTWKKGHERHRANSQVLAPCPATSHPGNTPRTYRRPGPIHRMKRPFHSLSFSERGTAPNDPPLPLLILAVGDLRDRACLRVWVSRDHSRPPRSRPGWSGFASGGGRRIPPAHSDLHAHPRPPPPARGVGDGSNRSLITSGLMLRPPRISPSVIH